MIQTEKTSPTVGAVELAGMGNTFADSISHQDFITVFPVGQVAISDFLSAGRENAVPLRHLVKLTGQDGRIVRRRIAAERLAGVPILADNKSGYYLPGTVAEAQRCVRSMRHRAHEILLAAEAIENAEIRQPYKQEVKRAADNALGQIRLDGV